MPIAAQCPSCGCPLSETSVLALAPVCESCGTVITEIGGTLGQTSAYGINDPTITRSRVAADLAVLRDYQNKYAGMLEACKEQLHWNVERYAKLPPQPSLLPLQPVPPLESCIFQGLLKAASIGFFCCGIGWLPILFFAHAVEIYSTSLSRPGWLTPEQHTDALRWGLLSGGVLILWWGSFLLHSCWPFYKANQANGQGPKENARRQREYESAYAEAVKAAEPVKAAQDHRLRVQIRELDGLINTVTKKANDVRRILESP